MGISTDSQNWTLIFGGDQLRKIEDPALRRELSTFMSGNYGSVTLAAVATKYREDVRRVIPDPVQVAIRRRFGDRPDPNGPQVLVLPKTCDLRLADAQAAEVAAALRANPQLVGELRWHLAAVATFLEEAESLEVQTRNLSGRIDRMN